MIIANSVLRALSIISHIQRARGIIVNCNIYGKSYAIILLFQVIKMLDFQLT